MAGSLVSVKLKDAAGVVATTDAYLNIGAANTALEITTALQTWLGLLANVTGATIEKCTFKLDVPVGPVAQLAQEATALVGHGMSLKFPQVTTNAPWDFLVPAYRSTVRIGSRYIMDEGGAIDLLANYMEAPIAGLTGAAFVSNVGNALKPAADAFYALRKHRKSTQRGSLSTGV